MDAYPSGKIAPIHVVPPRFLTGLDYTFTHRNPTPTPVDKNGGRCGPGPTGANVSRRSTLDHRLTTDRNRFTVKSLQIDTRDQHACRGPYHGITFELPACLGSSLVQASPFFHDHTESQFSRTRTHRDAGAKAVLGTRAPGYPTVKNLRSSSPDTQLICLVLIAERTLTTRIAQPFLKVRIPVVVL